MTPTQGQPLSEADVSLLPCPFCGGEAEIIHLDDDDNAGGSCVECTQCHASSNVEFEFKENFVSNWNRRPHAPVSRPAGEGEREAVARIIKERVSGPTFDDPAMYEKMDEDRLIAADDIISLLSPAAPDAGERIEALEAVLRNIAYMDCYTREGEEPIHLLMMRQAKAALQPGGER